MHFALVSVNGVNSNEGEQALKTIYTCVLTPNMSGSIMAEMKKRKSGVNR